MNSFCAGCGTSMQEGESVCAVCGRDATLGAAAPRVDPGVAFGLPPENSGKAIFSLICGLIFFFPPSALVAIIFGHLSLPEIRKSSGQLKGRGLAIGGLILGYLELACWTMLFVIGLVSMTKTMKALKSGNTTSVVSAMRTVNTAEIAYAQAHREVGYSCSLSELSQSWGMSPELARGRSRGYVVALQECSSQKTGGPITKYQVIAYPEVATAGWPAYCSNESDVIKIAANGSVQDCLRNGVDLPESETNSR